MRARWISERPRAPAQRIRPRLASRDTYSPLSGGITAWGKGMARVDTDLSDIMHVAAASKSNAVEPGEAGNNLDFAAQLGRRFSLQHM